MTITTMMVKAASSRKLRLCTVVLQELVARPVDSLDKPGMMGVRLQFTPELEDMDVDGAVKAVEVVAERLLDNQRPAEHAARLFDECAQYLELDGGKVERFN